MDSIDKKYKDSLSILQQMFPKIKKKLDKEIYPYRIYIRKPIIEKGVVIYTIVFASFLNNNIEFPFSCLDDDLNIVEPISTFDTILHTIQQEFHCKESQNMWDVIYDVTGPDGYICRFYIDKSLINNNV